MVQNRKSCAHGTRRCTPEGHLAQTIHCVTDHGLYRRPELAALVGKRTDAFLRMSDGLSESMPLNVALTVTELTHDDRISHEYARRAGGVFIRVSHRAYSDDDLLHAFLRVATELGEDSALLHRALHDGRINPDEAQALAIEIDQTVQAALELKARVLARAQVPTVPATTSLTLASRGGRS